MKQNDPRDWFDFPPKQPFSGVRFWVSCWYYMFTIGTAWSVIFDECLGRKWHRTKR